LERDDLLGRRARERGSAGEEERRRLGHQELSARTLAFSARRTLCCSVIVAQTGGSSSSSGLS
jgi:hypothetical protein